MNAIFNDYRAQIAAAPAVMAEFAYLWTAVEESVLPPEQIGELHDLIAARVEAARTRAPATFNAQPISAPQSLVAVNG